jgi:DNA-binding transcriptional MerR regulator
MATLPQTTQRQQAELPHPGTPHGGGHPTGHTQRAHGKHPKGHEQAGELAEAQAPDGSNSGADAAAEGGARQKALTIGAVCKALVQEFPDISISKIRYLEDQKLLTPRRTPGGYRLYTQSDVARLRTILRMQRDEFLPLRVIRQELAAGRADDMQVPRPGREGGQRAWHTSVSVREGDGALYSLEDVLEETSADAKLVRELEEYGVVKGEMRGGTRYFDETEREIVSAVSELARYGVGGRNLRVFRSSADRESSLLQQILAPALRSRNPQRRKDAVDALENLAAVTTHLKHLLLVRDLRKIVR